MKSLKENPSQFKYLTAQLIKKNMKILSEQRYIKMIKN